MPENIALYGKTAVPEKTAVKIESGSNEAAASGELLPEQMAAAGTGVKSHRAGVKEAAPGGQSAPGERVVPGERFAVTGALVESCQTGAKEAAPEGQAAPGERFAVTGALVESCQTGAKEAAPEGQAAPGERIASAGTADESHHTGTKEAAPGRGTAPAWPESADQAALDRIAAEILKHKETCVTAHPSFQLFFTHIFQSFMIRFEMEMCAVSEKYASEQAGKAEMLLRQAEWFTAARDLATTCVEMLTGCKGTVPLP